MFICLFLFRQDCRKAANCRYYIYSAAENQHFRGFRPAGATRCTDLREIWHGRGARWSAWPREFSRESVHGGGSGSASSEESFWSISFFLPNTANLTRTTKKQNTYKRKLGAQKMALINCRKRTRKICAKETGQTETGLVAFYDIRHGAGLFLQPRSPHRGNCTTIDDCRPV